MGDKKWNVTVQAFGNIRTEIVLASSRREAEQYLLKKIEFSIEATERVTVGTQTPRATRRRISGPAYTIDGEGRTRDVYSGELLDL